MPAGHRVTAANIDAILDQIEALSAVEVQLKYKTVTTSITNDNTHNDDPHLSGFTVVANGVYVVELFVNATIGAGGMDEQFTYPSGTAEASAFDYNNGTVTYANAWQRMSAAASSPHNVNGIAGGAFGGVAYRRNLTVFIGATGGSLSWQWRQNSSNAAATSVAKGSWMRVTRVA